MGRVRFLILFTLLATPGLSAARAPEAPGWLPRYEIAINLDIAGHQAHVTQHVAWVNRHQRPARELIFNVHSAFEPPATGVDRLFLAKLLEIMRVPSKESLYTGRPTKISKVSLLKRVQGGIETTALPFQFREDIPTALEVTLPHEVKQGETVMVAIDFVIDLPQKQGRWGQWREVTTLSNWLPVLAYYDEKGWRPTPFIPWHQPFFNEAGVYNVHLRLPADQKVAASGAITKRIVDRTDQELFIGPVTTREFTIVASSKFEEEIAWAGDVMVRCLAFPEHRYHAENIARIGARAVDTYSRWFGPYPNKELVFAESFFGWNGNECSGLVMVDERIFTMPKLATGYVEYLISHETCHQWFYNIIGTDGYRETFMDEAFANYFAHRLLNQIHGKNNAFFKYPRGLEWLPNVNREDYRFAQFYGTIGRGELGPPLLEMDKYKHVGNLFSAAYDRGSKIVGTIEERLGETAFFDFMRMIYSKYYFRIIFADDLQRELEEYTGSKWDAFFENWLRQNGLTDWSVESAEVERVKIEQQTNKGPFRAVVYLKQKADFDEPTTLGFQFEGEEGYPLRIPIDPSIMRAEALDAPFGKVEALEDHRVRVEILLPRQPTQITVDPDQILADKNPSNNHWKPRYRLRATPLYTFLDDNDLTTAYDRWNWTAGPWLYGPSYSDPWFTRTNVIGARVGAYRTQEFSGGVYTGYRTDFRDIAAGFDAQWTNILIPKLEGGIHGEISLAALDSATADLDRFVYYQRYVFQKSASLYTAPTHHIEAFAAWQNNFLPDTRNPVRNSVRFDSMSQLGVHYHLDLLTPYWDPEIGFRFDITYAAGVPIFGQPESSHQVMGQLSWVHRLPEGLGYLSRTKLAYRMYGAAATPTNALIFSLGGNLLFRGFDLKERQGSAMWIGSVEWRLPLIEDVEWDAFDHAVGVRNVNVALFYDIGDIYVRNRSIGPVAHAVGIGLRAELAWLSFIERTTFRLDFAKTVECDSPLQVWIGITHPF